MSHSCPMVLEFRRLQASAVAVKLEGRVRRPTRSPAVRETLPAGAGKPDSQSRPDPNFTPFGYPYAPGKRDPMTLTAAMGRMSDPSACLMLTEVDKLHPNFRGSTPGWFDSLPEGMAHSGYRLGLYWDGHVSKLDLELNPK